jgi:hypothetical protein
LGNDTEDTNLLIALHHQDTIGRHNFLLGQAAEQFEQCQQKFILETRQWNNSAFWAKNLTLALRHVNGTTQPSGQKISLWPYGNLDGPLEHQK